MQILKVVTLMIHKSRKCSFCGEFTTTVMRICSSCWEKGRRIADPERALIESERRAKAEVQIQIIKEKLKELRADPNYKGPSDFIPPQYRK